MEAIIYSPEAYLSRAQQVFSADFPFYCPTSQQCNTLIAAAVDSSSATDSSPCVNDILLVDPVLLSTVFPSTAGYATVTLLDATDSDCTAPLLLPSASHDTSFSFTRSSPSRCATATNMYAGTVRPVNSMITCRVEAKPWPYTLRNGEHTRSAEMVEAELQYFRDAVVLPAHTMQILCAAEGARVQLCFHTKESVVEAESILLGFTAGGVGEETTSEAHMRSFIAPYFIRQRRAVSVGEHFLFKNENRGELHVTVAAVNNGRGNCGIVAAETRVSLMLLPEAPPHMQGRSSGPTSGQEMRKSLSRRQTVSPSRSRGPQKTISLSLPPLPAEGKAAAQNDDTPRTIAIAPARRSTSMAATEMRFANTNHRALSRSAESAGKMYIYEPSPIRVNRGNRKGAGPISVYTPQSIPKEQGEIVSDPPLRPAQTHILIINEESKEKSSRNDVSEMCEKEQRDGQIMPTSGSPCSEANAEVLPSVLERARQLKKETVVSCEPLQPHNLWHSKSPADTRVVFSTHSDMESEQSPEKQSGCETPRELDSVSKGAPPLQRQQVKNMDSSTQCDQVGSVEKSSDPHMGNKELRNASTSPIPLLKDYEDTTGGALSDDKKVKTAETEEKGAAVHCPEEISNIPPWKPRAATFGTFMQDEALSDPHHTLGAIKTDNPLENIEPASVAPAQEVSIEKSDAFTQYDPPVSAVGSSGLPKEERPSQEFPTHNVNPRLKEEDEQEQQNNKNVSNSKDECMELPHSEVSNGEQNGCKKALKKESENLNKNDMDGHKDDLPQKEAEVQDFQVRRDLSSEELPCTTLQNCRSIVQEWIAVKKIWNKLPIDPLLQSEPYNNIKRFHHFLALYKEVKQRHADCIAYLDSPYSHTMRGGMVVRISLTMHDPSVERRKLQDPHKSTNRPSGRAEADINISGLGDSDVEAHAMAKAKEMIKVSAREVRAALGHDILHVFRVGCQRPALYCTLVAPFTSDGPAEITLRGEPCRVEVLSTTIMEDLCQARDESRCEWLEHFYLWEEAVRSVLRLGVFSRHLQTVRELFWELSMFLRHLGALQQSPIFLGCTGEEERKKLQPQEEINNDVKWGRETKRKQGLAARCSASPFMPRWESSVFMDDQEGFLHSLQELQDTYYLFSELLEPFALQTLHLMDAVAAITDFGQCGQMMDFIRVSYDAQMAEEEAREAGDLEIPHMLAHAEKEKEAFAELVRARKSGAIVPLPSDWLDDASSSANGKDDVYEAGPLRV